ncbi:hypothetical protein AR457_37445 [Streptomyces agglomeratus]|uniref:Uncharacterized protein n=1 Tax=Streptomyces agglomeratus TaxID=285458 RepID=A0A1E5NYX8_9ACTN|nr:hypothetical protein [Streptomyces agglomeratus]OEJ21479.1 hypothetical protein AS594_38675 [Streptomyces agglomeratus]OEJ22913.1 hypothetical protein AR457_37445 [Streptomyces agglomeratus]OEJ36490.1 hypothetical protein BGK72_37945 [Streptomyces agglomeratus]
MQSRTVPLDLIIGPERAGQVVGALVRDLITSDLLPEPVAYRLVCEGVLAGDPWLLAEAGQLWTLRPDTGAGDEPELLFIVSRDTTQLTVEDADGRRSQIPLCTLAAYQLDQWYWAR